MVLSSWRFCSTRERTWSNERRKYVLLHHAAEFAAGASTGVLSGQRQEQFLPTWLFGLLDGLCDCSEQTATECHLLSSHAVCHEPVEADSHGTIGNHMVPESAQELGRTNLELM